MSSVPYGLGGLQGDSDAMIPEVFHPEHFYPTSSFIPLNRRPPMPFVNPHDTLHCPDADVSIYDLPQDDDESLNEVPHMPAKKSRKRPSAEAKQGREVSLGAVWSYTDEEDIVFEVEEKHEVVATSKPAKRAKSAPAKKSKAKKAPYKIQNSDLEGLDEEEPINSQLTTPLDSSKGKGKMGRVTTSKTKKGKLPSFRNLTITKAIEPQGKGNKEPVEAPSAVIRYQGWTSTQDTVKSYGLMQTTIDKLAAFRYNPNPSKTVSTSTPISNEHHSREQDEHFEQPSISTSFEGQDVLNNGGTYTQAVWATEVDGPFVTEPAPEQSQQESILPEHDQEVEVIYRPEAILEGLLVSNIEPPTASLDEEGLQPSRAWEPQNRESDEAYQHHEPISSEALVSMDVDNEIAETQRDMPFLPAVTPKVRGLAGETVAQNPREDAIEVNAYSDGNTVPRLHVVCEIDEFDDGLNDDDFMAITDEVTLIELPVAVLPAAAKPSSPIAHANLDLVPHLPLVNMDSDEDEYPMDAGEDDRMLELSEYPDLVVEKHHAPSNLQNEIDFQEEYDSSLQFSPPPLPGAKLQTSANNHSDPLSPIRAHENDSQDEFEDWAFMNTELDDVMRKAEVQKAPTTAVFSQSQITDHFKTPAPKVTPKVNPKAAALILDDSHEYYPLERFARPEFPEIVRDRCPIVGVSAQSFLRVCFRIGELFKEGARCSAAGQDAVIELFARVNFSSREGGTTKQHFRFMDLWSEHPPFPTGILANYKSSSLADSESLFFVGDMGKGEMVRCLGRLKKEKKSDTCWIFDIINVRGTDWEEIRWTKKIVDAGAERGLSKL